MVSKAFSLCNVNNLITGGVQMSDVLNVTLLYVCCILWCLIPWRCDVSIKYFDSDSDSVMSLHAMFSWGLYTELSPVCVVYLKSTEPIRCFLWIYYQRHEPSWKTQARVLSTNHSIIDYVYLYLYISVCGVCVLFDINNSVCVAVYVSVKYHLYITWHEIYLQIKHRAPIQFKDVVLPV